MDHHNSIYLEELRESEVSMQNVRRCLDMFVTCRIIKAFSNSLLQELPGLTATTQALYLSFSVRFYFNEILPPSTVTVDYFPLSRRSVYQIKLGNIERERAKRFLLSRYRSFTSLFWATVSENMFKIKQMLRIFCKSFI